MVESVGWRSGWGFVLACAAALGAMWYLRHQMGIGWALWGYVGVAVVVSIAALLVVLDTWQQVGGGSEREFSAMSDIYAMAIESPWWSKAVVVMGGLVWVVV